MTEHFQDTGFIPLKIAILTVSDTRTETDDKSGGLLKAKAEAAGHRVVAKEIVPDDVYRMRAVFSRWIADPEVQVVLSTGGTGITGRDSTPEAVAPLFDKQIEGFGELFRSVSFEEIGTSTVQSTSIFARRSRLDLSLTETNARRMRMGVDTPAAYRGAPRRSRPSRDPRHGPRHDWPVPIGRAAPTRGNPHDAVHGEISAERPR